MIRKIGFASIQKKLIVCFSVLAIHLIGVQEKIDHFFVSDGTIKLSFPYIEHIISKLFASELIFKKLRIEFLGFYVFDRSICFLAF